LGFIWRLICCSNKGKKIYRPGCNGAPIQTNRITKMILKPTFIRLVGVLQRLFVLMKVSEVVMSLWFSWRVLSLLAVTSGLWGPDWVVSYNAPVDPLLTPGRHLPTLELLHSSASRRSGPHSCWPYSARHLYQKVGTNILLCNVPALNWGVRMLDEPKSLVRKGSRPVSLFKLRIVWYRNNTTDHLYCCEVETL